MASPPEARLSTSSRIRFNSSVSFNCLTESRLERLSELLPVAQLLGQELLILPLRIDPAEAHAKGKSVA